MTTTEIILASIAAVETIISFPVWKALLKIRDTVKGQEELKKNLVDNVHQINITLSRHKEELHKRINEVSKDQDKVRIMLGDLSMQVSKEMSEDRLAFTEILGKLNLTLSEIKGAIKNFDENKVLEREYWKEQFASINKDLDEHRKDTKEEFKLLRIK